MSADRVARAAAAAEQLSDALWEVLRERAEAGDTSAVTELSNRLGDVLGSLGAIADTGVGDSDAARLEGTSDANMDGDDPEPGTATSWNDDHRPVEDPSSGGIRSDDSDGPRWGTPEGGVIELATVERGKGGASREAALSASDEATVGRLRRFAGHAAALVDEYEDDDETIELRDVRAGGQAPIGAAVRRRLERYDADRVPFAILLIEVLDVERLRALRAAGDLLREIWSVESAIAEQLRPADTLLREIDGRWWLIAPDTDALAARELAERLSAAARRFAHRGTPLAIVVGIAICPQHGLDVSTLIGHADVDLYAAQAAGRSVGGFDDENRPA